MSTTDNRAPEDIEGDIEHTRSEMRETLDAIQSKLTPAQMMDEAMNYFRNGPGEFASNLGQIVRNNPVPVALVGVGLAWLAVSGTRRESSSDQDEYDYEEERYYYASAGARDYPATGESDYEGTGGSYRSAAAAPEYYGSTGAAYAAGSGGDYGSSSRGYAGREYSGNYGSDYGSDDEDRYGYGGSSYQEGGRLGRLTEGARGGVSRIGGMARERGQRAREGLAGMATEQPVMMAAAAFVIGAALGALLPSTRRENEWMGEARDNLKHRAAAAGREGLDRAARATEETWSAVGDETLEQEGTRDGGGASNRSTTGGQSSSASQTTSTASKSAAGASASAKSGAAGTTPSSTAGGTTSSGTTPGKKAPDTKQV